MKNKKIIIALLCVMAMMGYFFTTYTTGKSMCKKLNLENANTVIAAYDNGGTINAPSNYTVTLAEDEKAQLIDYLKSLNLKKYRGDYRTVESFEVYAFDFKFENSRTVVYLWGDKYVSCANTTLYEMYSIL